MDYIYYIGPEILTKHKDGKSVEISHDIYYWSENREPLPTFNVTYKIKEKVNRKKNYFLTKLMKKKKISVESFDENGMLSDETT